MVGGDSAWGQSSPPSPRRGRSNWWFLLPIFLSIIGGVIAYFALRADDPAKAKNCLYLGIALTVVSIAMNLVLAAQFDAFMGALDYDVSG